MSDLRTQTIQSAVAAADLLQAQLAAERDPAKRRTLVRRLSDAEQRIAKLCGESLAAALGPHREARVVLYPKDRESEAA
jgi:hypothetical protein